MLITISVLVVACLLFLFSLIMALSATASSLSSWVGRIKIGQWDNREKWRDAVASKARKWLNHTPVVPANDKIFHRKSVNVQFWQIGGLLLGLDDKDAERFVSTHPDIYEKGASPVETSFLAYTLKCHHQLGLDQEQKLKSSLCNLVTRGTLQYRDTACDLRYVDTIGLACPFMCSAGMEDAADRQIAEFDRTLYDGVFPPHAFDPVRNLPMGVYDWSRGMGWYILGLISSENNKERVTRLASRMLDFQRSDGSFGCFLFNPSSRKESSGTALAGLLLTTAYEWGDDVRFLQAARKAESALMSMTRRNGAIDYAQGDTKDIGMYSGRFDTMPFVQGIALVLSKKIDALSTK